MDLQLSAERQTQLAAYAQRHGQDPLTALDQLLAEALDSDRSEYERAVAGIQRGYDSVRAGRTRSASVFLEELRSRHGL